MSPARAARLQSQTLGLGARTARSAPFHAGRNHAGEVYKAAAIYARNISRSSGRAAYSAQTFSTPSTQVTA